MVGGYFYVGSTKLERSLDSTLDKFKKKDPEIYKIFRGEISNVPPLSEVFEELQRFNLYF